MGAVWRSVAATEQYLFSLSAMASRTALSSSCPRSLYTTSSFTQTVGGSAARSPETTTSSDSSFWRFLARIATTSVAVQAPRATSSISIGPGAVLDFLSASSATAWPECDTARNCSLPAQFTRAVCMKPPGAELCLSVRGLQGSKQAGHHGSNSASGTGRPTTGLRALADGRDSSLHDGVRQTTQRLEEDLHQLRVELGAAAALQFGKCLFGPAGLLVGAVGSNRVVGVRDGEDARAQRDVAAGEAIGAARRVEEFVVVLHHLPDLSDAEERVEDLGAKVHVGLHRLPFVGVERA